MKVNLTYDIECLEVVVISCEKDRLENVHQHFEVVAAFAKVFHYSKSENKRSSYHIRS